MLWDRRFADNEIIRDQRVMKNVDELGNVSQIVFSCTEYMDRTDELDPLALPDAIVLTEDGEVKD